MDRGIKNRRYTSWSFVMKIVVSAEGKVFLVLKKHTMNEYGGAEV
jgi:hypothetical protein